MDRNFDENDGCEHDMPLAESKPRNKHLLRMGGHGSIVGISKLTYCIRLHNVNLAIRIENLLLSVGYIRILPFFQLCPASVAIVNSRPQQI